LHLVGDLFELYDDARTYKFEFINGDRKLRGRVGTYIPSCRASPAV